MILSITRVFNGARWIAEHLSSVLSICDHALVLDNHSTDDTVDICNATPHVTVLSNSSTILNEAGDKNQLVAEAKRRFNPDWIVFLDADEILIDYDALLSAIQSGKAPAYMLHIWSCWNSPSQVRVDGIYGRCWRSSCFDLRQTDGRWVERSPNGPNLHCNNIPADLQGRAQRAVSPEVRVRHYGYMLKEDRLRKYRWYHDIDPQGLYLAGEDSYRHSIQGDVPEFPAEARYMHGGPLSIAPFPP